MTDIDTSPEAVERLMDGVTPGPWRKSYSFATQVASSSSVVCNAMLHENARFIAAARQLVPALSAERDRLTADNAALREALMREAKGKLARLVEWLQEDEDNASLLISALSPEQLDDARAALAASQPRKTDTNEV
jgi:hypothetical protein